MHPIFSSIPATRSMSTTRSSRRSRPMTACLSSQTLREPLSFPAKKYPTSPKRKIGTSTYSISGTLAAVVGKDCDSLIGKRAQVGKQQLSFRLTLLESRFECLRQRRVSAFVFGAKHVQIGPMEE